MYVGGEEEREREKEEEMEEGEREKESIRGGVKKEEREEK